VPCGNGGVALCSLNAAVQTRRDRHLYQTHFARVRSIVRDSADSAALRHCTAFGPENREDLRQIALCRESRCRQTEEDGQS